MTIARMPRAVFVSAPGAQTSNRRYRIMSAFTSPLLRVRIHAENPNHHLWNNHGTWFLHYTVHPTPFTKERVRRSLGTSSLDAARERRDAFFTHHPAQAFGSYLQAVA
jgi:hypothetical protein